MRLSARVLVVSAELTKWRAARKRRQRLARDIACFVTPGERQELLSMLDRYPDEVSHEVRDALDRNLAD
jgi:hypothetical protein